MQAKLVELIETQERRGEGKTEEDPIRIVTQWYTKEGELVVELDPFKYNGPLYLDGVPWKEPKK